MKCIRCSHQQLIGLAALLLLLVNSNSTFSQIRNVIHDDPRKIDIVDVFKHSFKPNESKMKEKKDKIIKIKQQNKKVYVSFIPVSTKKRGSKDVYVSSVSSAFYLGKSDSTYISNVSLEPATNFSNKFGIGYRFNLWTKNNTWNIPGEITITNLDQYTWGLGSATIDSMKYRIATKYIKFHVNFNKNFHNSRVFFYGVGFNYDRYYNLVPDISSVNIEYLEKYVVGNENSLFSSGFNLSLLYDSRRNSVNPSQGMFASAIFRNSPSVMGNKYLWSSVYLDFRSYVPISNFNINRRSILAFWIMYWGSFGKVPYLLLPATSTDLNGQSGRGYNFARFRGKEMIYAESEYRFDISKNGLFGGVVYANVESFTEPDTNQFAYLLPAVGMGARIKINKKSNTNLGLDLSYGKLGFNFAAVLGEAF